MAEGVFTIQADINPTVNVRALEQAAAQISGQLNTLLAKQTKGLNISGSIQGFNPKAIETTTQATNIFSKALNETKKAFSSVSDTAKTSFLAVSNRVGLTTKSVVAFGDSLVQNIKNSSRFNDALAAINRSGAALKGLPDNFKELAAQINSGTSALDRAAAGGNQFAAAIQPITQLTVGVRSALVQVDTGIQSLAASTRNLVSGGAGAGFGLLADQTDLLRDKINNLATKTTPQLGQEIKNTFERAAAQGPQALVDALQKVREVQGTAIAAGGGATINVSAAIRAALFDIDKDVLSFTDRFAERFSRLAGSINRDFVAPVKSAIQNAFKDTNLNAGFFESLRVRFAVLKDEGTGSIRALGTSLKDTLGDTRIGSPFKSLVGDAKELGAATSSVVGDIKTKFQELQRTSKQGAGVFDFDAATQSGNKFFSTITNGVKAFATGAANVNPLKNLLSGEGGGQAGSASISLLLAPLNALKAVLGGFGKVASLPFAAIGGAAKAAAAPVGILKNVVGSALGELGGLAAGGVGIVAALTAIGVASLNTAAKFETYKIAFDGLFGEGSGNKVLNLALDFDKLTHFDLSTTINSILQLSGAIKNIQPTGAVAILSQLAGAAAAVGAGGDTIQRVVLAFTQISAAGKLTAQDLNQITQALPPISRTNVYSQIAKDLKITNVAAKKLAAEGLLDSETALTAVLKVAHDVPGAASAMEKQSQSFKGLLTIVQNNLQKLLVQIGGPILKVAKATLEGLIIIFEKLGPVIVGAGKAFETLGNALTHIPVLGGFVARIMRGMAASFGETNTAAQGLAGTGLQDAINALNVLKNTSQAFTAALPAANAGLEEQQRKLKELADAANAKGLLGPFLGNANTLQPVAKDIQAVNLAFQDLAKTKDIGALKTGLDTLENFAKTFKLPPELQKSFDDFISSGRDKVDTFNASFGELLNKVLSAGAAFKAQKDATKAVAQSQQSYNDLIREHNDQLATQKISLTKALRQANDQLTTSNLALIDAQTALNKVLLGASAEEAERADLSLASAKLRLRQLIEDEKNAQDALNNTQKASVNLVGLSLDQVKSRLNSVRLSLSAQKATTAAQAAGAKNEEQLAITAAQHTIDKRNAELDIVDAQKQVNDLKVKGTETDPDVIAARKAVAAAEKDIANNKETQIEAQAALNKLSAVDISFERQKQAAADAITAAKEASKKADQDAAIAVATARGDQETINKLLAQQIKDQGPALLGILNDSIKKSEEKIAAEKLFGDQIDISSAKIDIQNGKVRALNDLLLAGAAAAPNIQADADKKTRDALDAAAQKLFSKKNAGVKVTLTNGEVVSTGKNGSFVNAKGETLQPLLSVDALSVLLQANSQNLNDDAVKKLINSDTFKGLLTNSTFVNQVVDALIKDPNSDLRKVFQQIFKNLNIKVSGFAEGGLIDGVPGSFGRLVRVGERGRSEAILPLENRAALQNLMAQPGILNPILGALPRISLPQNQASPAIDLGPVQGPRSSGGASAAVALQEQNKRDQALAKAIVSELKAAGFTGNQINVQNDFTLPNTDDPLSNLKVKQMAREVKRQLESDW